MRRDDPLYPLVDNYSAARWERRENARDRGDGEKKPDDLVRLISDKLWGIR